jgi:hypothetical protein
MLSTLNISKIYFPSLNLPKSISVSVWQDLATLRDALGNKDTGSSGQAIQFLAAGAQKSI